MTLFRWPIAIRVSIVTIPPAAGFTHDNLVVLTRQPNVWERIIFRSCYAWYYLIGASGSQRRHGRSARRPHRHGNDDFRRVLTS